MIKWSWNFCEKNLESRFSSGYTQEYFVVWYSWAGIESCAGLVNDLEGLLYLHDKRMSSEAL